MYSKLRIELVRPRGLELSDFQFSPPPPPPLLLLLHLSQLLSLWCPQDPLWYAYWYRGICAGPEIMPSFTTSCEVLDLGIFMATWALQMLRCFLDTRFWRNCLNPAWNQALAHQIPDLGSRSSTIITWYPQRIQYQSLTHQMLLKFQCSLKKRKNCWKKCFLYTSCGEYMKWGL